MTEWQLEHQILDYLTLKGHFAWITHGPRNKPLVPGIPDIMGLNRFGQMFAVEVKGEKGKLSNEQREMLEKLCMFHCVICVARDLADVQDAGL